MKIIEVHPDYYEITANNETVSVFAELFPVIKLISDENILCTKENFSSILTLALKQLFADETPLSKDLLIAETVIRMEIGLYSSI